MNMNHVTNEQLNILIIMLAAPYILWGLWYIGRCIIGFAKGFTPEPAMTEEEFGAMIRGHATSSPTIDYALRQHERVKRYQEGPRMMPWQSAPSTRYRGV